MSDKFTPITGTLEEAKEWLRKRVDKGASCPCCTQFAKVYKRKLNSSMARGLLVLLRYATAHPDEDLHIPSIFREEKVCSSNDGALLRHWGLIQACSGVRSDGSTRIGFYRLTQLGREFALDRVSVPMYAILYSERLLRLSKEQTSIRDALGNKFNYQELMSVP
jgi:hypothetical protein